MASSIFGKQKVVSIDFKFNGKFFEVYENSGKDPTGKDIISWSKKLEQLGAGEIVLTDITLDGTSKGLNIKVASNISKILKIPVVISGGCGKASHFTDCFNTTDVQGIAAGNFFSNRDQNVYQTRAQLINSKPLRSKMKREKRVLIIDSGLGNINSLVNCIDSLDFKYQVISDPNTNIDFDKIIFPGVGSYNFAMKLITEKKWDFFIKKNILDDKKYFLGICIGMQVLSNIGHENKITNGLGIIDSEVKIFNSEKNNIKLPHIGWNDVEKINPSELFEGVQNFSDFYFDHSYVMEVENEKYITSLTDYKTFVSSKAEYLWGTVSSKKVLKNLANFLNPCYFNL